MLKILLLCSTIIVCYQSEFHAGRAGSKGGSFNAQVDLHADRRGRPRPVPPLRRLPRRRSPLPISYRGKTNILIGHPPGGSYDLYAQLIAQHFGKQIPGNPTVIVQGMPGGGGSLAAAHFYTKAAKDGTIVALLPESLAQDQVLRPEKEPLGRFQDALHRPRCRRDLGHDGPQGLAG